MQDDEINDIVSQSEIADQDDIRRIVIPFIIHNGVHALARQVIPNNYYNYRNNYNNYSNPIFMKICFVTIIKVF